MLKLDNVTISYKNVPTVQNFNLDMKEGQIVSLVGESGSGKTTVIRAVLGLLAGGGKVTEGSITFEGEDLLSYTPEQNIFLLMRTFPRKRHGVRESQCWSE